nr:YetF domain-containing protein [Methanosarcina sp. DH2]
MGYIALVLLLRISGNRTLSKLNAFDFVITIALGSSFGALILNKNVALADGIMAFTVLIGMQHVITWLTIRSNTLKRVIRNEPSLVYYNGEYIKNSMKRSRVVEDEIEQSVRNQGYANLEHVGAVILETDGSFSIISQSEKEGKELDIAGLKA